MVPAAGQASMKPDATQYNPDPEYFTELVESTGITVTELAVTIGHDRRTIQRWMSGARQYPYTAQFALEVLVLTP